MAFFYFGPVGPNIKITSKAPQKGKISHLFLPKFNRHYGISKMVLYSIRLRELNLMGFRFWINGPKQENLAPVPPKTLKLNLVLTKVLLAIRNFQKILIKYEKVKRTELTET